MLLEYIKKEKEYLPGLQYDYVLVTLESRRSTVKLPAACRYYDIAEMDLIEFFQDNAWTFKLKLG